MNTLPFYIFLFLHLTFLIVGFGAVLVIDFLGIVWIRGKISKRIFAHVTRYTRKLIWLGWIGLVCSGVGLIILKGYIDNLTKLKLFFVLMIGVNGVILGSIQKSLDKADGDSIPVFLKFRIVIATIVSQISHGRIISGFIYCRLFLVLEY